MNRRDLIKSAAGLFGLSLTGFTLRAAEEKTREEIIRAELNNGLDKIYRVSNWDEYTPLSNLWAGFPLTKTRYVAVPLHHINTIGNVNDTAWHTLLSAGQTNVDKVFPSTSFEAFINTKTTDLFVDSSVCKYTAFKYKDFEGITVHTVDLAKYYNFYTERLGGKFRKYTSNLILACNLRHKPNARIIVKNPDYVGVCITEDNHFMLGQI